MLKATNLFALNNRVPHRQPGNHTPQYTWRGIVQTSTGTVEQCSVLDYVLMPPQLCYH
jgi:hypothetical protein